MLEGKKAVKKLLGEVELIPGRNSHNAAVVAE
jgi:hypothetical protein